MQIKRLLVEEIRNLKQVTLEDLEVLNFFVGPNGAGKTSLLEAISIASQGRSFRNNKVQTVINQQESALRVFIECVDEDSVHHKIGIERDRKNQYIIRIDGAYAQTLAELSAILPVVILDSTSFDLLDGSPSVRRKFIDWGVFHVEHGFYENWKAFNRALKQRNALLRAQVQDYKIYEPWDIELVSHAVEIERHRMHFLESYHPYLQSTLEALGAETGHEVYYKSGWSLDRVDMNDNHDFSNTATSTASASQLLSLLQTQFQRDLKFQITHLGPHKADIQLRLHRSDVKDIYSRGQKKTLVAAMKLAQAKAVKASNNHKSPVLLLDDLPSELDDEHLQKFLQYVISEGYQCFITAVDDRIYKTNAHVKARMFHVERGKITPIIDVSRGTWR